jgi:RHH-type proline utilization regulon transcriptional repressor/proline dehydrogenase/delta 1-pyrroline-5-carboxylate dehydrogenase
LILGLDRPHDTDRAAIHRAYRQNERDALLPLAGAARLVPAAGHQVLNSARQLAQRARLLQHEGGGVDALLHEYDLSSAEGVLLMCLAEALLRIPDRPTQLHLIRDKLSRGHWDTHLGHSPSLFVNASTWGLLLTGRVVALGGDEATPATLLQRLVARTGEQVVRPALTETMGLIARDFVFGATLEDALHRARQTRGTWRYSFDCLGEAARCAADAERYFDAYRDAIRRLREETGNDTDPIGGPGISVKLSALHPRYEYAKRHRIMKELAPRLHRLALDARDGNIALTVDAEEADRLDLSLDIFAALYTDRDLRGWAGLGLAVQAYQKRALPVLEWLAGLSRRWGRRIPIRLVKGAYWDTEIKRAQERGVDGYPVFTRKNATDVSYLACVRYLFDHTECFYPQFATHNAYTVAYVMAAAGDRHDFEFQRLHGMGEPLYQAMAEQIQPPPPCRVYAPVGSHEALLPYLVRRLLENGANTSFINQLADEQRPVEELITDPLVHVQAVDYSPHPDIPLPRDLYGDARCNSAGIDTSDPLQLSALDEDLAAALKKHWSTTPWVAGAATGGETRAVTDPADRRRVVGEVTSADASLVEQAMAAAHQAASGWETTPADRRAEILERAADLFEVHRAELTALVVREGGRTVVDALAEVREAVDALRYYAAEARRLFAAPHTLTGATGELNHLYLRGRGVFACVSPWNFPVAIFTAQMAAALAAGNAVIAKPARQTPLAAGHAVRLLHEAGLPEAVLHLLPGSAAALSEPLLDDPRLAGVAMTGATETAWAIQSALAGRRGPIIPLIAETGGQNMMIVDSTALPEQVVTDALHSAFNSAGQRCSALRVLYVQNDIADRLIELLVGAMEELEIGDPVRLSTDVGPLIDDAACRGLREHVDRMNAQGKLLKALPLPDGTEHGSFFPPHLYEISDAAVLEKEVFGPVLHLVRFPAGALDQVIDSVNASGYGLTLGVHSRIEATWERVRRRARVGNLYVNRNMIGSVIGVQPFGGEGLSGTGPKAGGPHYLPRFATERTVTVNTTAVGGNASLLSLKE